MAQASPFDIVEGPQGSAPPSPFDIVEGPPGHDQPTSGLSAKTAARVKTMQERRAKPTSEPVLEALQGVGQGAISTVQTLATPIRKAFGMQPAEPPPAATTPAMQAGRAAEQVGEFFVPEAVAGKVAGAAKVGRLAKTGIKAGLTAAGTYGVAKEQGDARPGVAAAIGAAGPALELTAPAAYKLLRTGAKAGLAKVLGASTLAPDVINTAVQKVVPVALDEGLKPTWASWLKQRSLAKGKAGVALAEGLKGPLGGSLVPTQPVIDALDELANKSAQHVMRAEETLAEATKPTSGQVANTTVVYNKRLMKTINELKGVLKQHGDVVQARQLHDLKKSWDEFVYKANEFPNTKKILVGLEARAKNAGANAIRGVLESDAPKIADLDKAYSLNVRLYDLVRKSALGGEQSAATAKATSRLESLVSRRTGAMSAGAAAGGYGGSHSKGLLGMGQVEGIVEGTIVGGATGRLLEAAFSSPAWRTKGPAFKQMLADAIASRKADTVRRLLTPILAKTGAGSPAEAK